MLTGGEYALLLTGMGLVTFVPRWVPLYFMSRRSVAPWLVEWLEMIPAAILSALLVPALLTGGSPPEIDWFQPKLLAALPTFVFAFKTRSLGGTVVVGMLVYWLLGRLMGD